MLTLATETFGARGVRWFKFWPINLTPEPVPLASFSTTSVKAWQFGRGFLSRPFPGSRPHVLHVYYKGQADNMTITSGSASVHGLGETWRIPSVFYLPPWHMKSPGLSMWRRHLQAAQRLRIFRCHRPSAECYHQGHFPIAAPLASLLLALTYIGKEKGTKNTQNRLSEIPALPWGLAAAERPRACHSPGDEDTQGQQDTPWLLTEHSRASEDRTPERCAVLIPQ